MFLSRIFQESKLNINWGQIKSSKVVGGQIWFKLVKNISNYHTFRHGNWSRIRIQGDSRPIQVI